MQTHCGSISLPKRLLIACYFMNTSSIYFLSFLLVSLSADDGSQSKLSVDELLKTAVDRECCRVETNRSVILSRLEQQTLRQYVVDYTNVTECGHYSGFLLGIRYIYKNCTETHGHYENRVVTKTVYFREFREMPCPEEKQICCNGYLAVGNKCYNLGKK